MFIRRPSSQIGPSARQKLWTLARLCPAPNLADFALAPSNHQIAIPDSPNYDESVSRRLS
jgi:hypothetical protein